MAARKPSPITRTGLGPIGLHTKIVDVPLHRVRRGSGPTSPKRSKMPSFGPSRGQKIGRENILPLVRGSGGARRVGG